MTKGGRRSYTLIPSVGHRLEKNWDRIELRENRSHLLEALQRDLLPNAPDKNDLDVQIAHQMAAALDRRCPKRQVVCHSTDTVSVFFEEMR